MRGMWGKRDPLKRDESSPLNTLQAVVLVCTFILCVCLPVPCVCFYLFHVYLFTCYMCMFLPVWCVCVYLFSVYVFTSYVCVYQLCVCMFTCSMCVDVAGFDGNIHWQEMPFYWQRQHPWPYLVGCGAQDEDAEDDSDPSWIPSLRQEVQPLREEAQEHVCSPQPSFQVCTVPSVYSTVFWGDRPALVFYTFLLVPGLCSVLCWTALYSTVKFPLFLGGGGVLPPSFFPSDLLHIHLQFLSAFPLGVTKWFSFLSSPPPICCTPPPHPTPISSFPSAHPTYLLPPSPCTPFSLVSACPPSSPPPPIIPPSICHPHFYLPLPHLSSLLSPPPPPRPPILATPASVSPFPLLPTFLHHPVCLLSYDLCLPCPLPPPLSWKGVLVKWDRSVCCITQFSLLHRHIDENAQGGWQSCGVPCQLHCPFYQCFVWQ